MSLDDSRRSDWLAMQRRLGRSKEQEPELPLHGGGSGGTYDGMVPIKDYVDARDEAVESRLKAKLDTLATKGTIWGAVATAVAVAVTIISFAGDRFDSGIGMADQRQAQIQRDNAQDKAVADINRKLDILVAAQSKKATASKP